MSLVHVYWESLLATTSTSADPQPRVVRRANEVRADAVHRVRASSATARPGVRMATAAASVNANFGIEPIDAGALDTDSARCELVPHVQT
jgi:hypothetical protein